MLISGETALPSILIIILIELRRYTADAAITAVPAMEHMNLWKAGDMCVNAAWITKPALSQQALKEMP